MYGLAALTNSTSLRVTLMFKFYFIAISEWMLGRPWWRAKEIADDSLSGRTL